MRARNAQEGAVWLVEDVRSARVSTVSRVKLNCGNEAQFDWAYQLRHSAEAQNPGTP